MAEEMQEQQQPQSQSQHSLQPESTLIAYRIHKYPSMPIVPASSMRDWMDKTHERFAYRCLPLTIANQTGWCVIDPLTFESAVHKNVHVLGDASIAGGMPKSGFAANSQGKVAALAIVNALNGRPMAAPTYVNTCYSLIAPDYGISVADVYRVTPQGIVPAPNAGGVSPANADATFRANEARYAESWYASMSREIWDA